MKFKQAIQIGKNANGILKLPCVMGCHKDDNDELVFILYDWDECGNYIEARKGNWLCEDYDGKWCVLTSKEYGKL